MITHWTYRGVTIINFLLVLIFWWKNLKCEIKRPLFLSLSVFFLRTSNKLRTSLFLPIKPFTCISTRIHLKYLIFLFIFLSLIQTIIWKLHQFQFPTILFLLLYCIYFLLILWGYILAFLSQLKELTTFLPPFILFWCK